MLALSLRARLIAICKDKACLSMLLLAVLLHGLMAASFHLSPDETHYALFSVNLDWSNFDHPPLSGWLQWPFAQLGGHNVVMRVLPMTCWALAALGLMLLTAEFAPAEQQLLAARAAMVLWLLSPIAHLLGLALVPDTLLLPLTCGVMFVTWRLCANPGVRSLSPASLWLGLGLLLGLAGLSKYTAVLVAVGAILALLLAHGPSILGWPQAWLATLLASVLISPVILWNASHDWISLAYQFGHAKGTADWRVSRAVGYVLVQLLGYGLLLVVGFGASRRLPAHLAAIAKATPSASSGENLSLKPRNLSVPLFCACFALPTLLLLVALSGRGSTLPHWSAAAWVALLPAAALGAAGLWQKRRKMLWALAAFQAFCCVGLAGLMLSGGLSSENKNPAFTTPGQKVEGAVFNPFADLYGWDAAALQGKALAEQHGNATLAVFNWTLASRIAWYARPLPVKVVQRHLDQFGLWWGTLKRGESVLLVDWSQMSFVPPVGADQFERCQQLAQQPVMRWGRQIAHFNFLLCDNWLGPLGLPLDPPREPRQ